MLFGDGVKRPEGDGRCARAATAKQRAGGIFSIGDGGSGCGDPRHPYEASAPAEGAPTSLTPEEALAKLKAGDGRAMSAVPEMCSLDLAEQRTSVAAHQAPWATVIGCADSRTPPELVFGGHVVGGLFVARNAGNLVDTATFGTVEYGAAVLGSPLIVMLRPYSLRRRQGRLRRRVGTRPAIPARSVR